MNYNGRFLVKKWRGKIFWEKNGREKNNLIGFYLYWCSIRGKDRKKAIPTLLWAK